MHLFRHLFRTPWPVARLKQPHTGKQRGRSLRLDRHSVVPLLWGLTAFLVPVAGCGGGGGGGTTTTGGNVRVATLTVNDIAYNPVTGKLLVSVPGSAAANGNTLAVLNPNTLAVEGATAVGSEPKRVVVSDDGRFAYVGLDGAAAVRRVNLQTMTPDLQFGLGQDFGPNYAEDIAVMPGNDDTVAVSRYAKGIIPRHTGVALYDQGVQRPTTTPDFTGANVVRFGATTNRLYGYDNESSEAGLYRFTVAVDGVSELDVTQGVVSGEGANIVFDHGRIYASSGAVVDAESRTVLGTLSPGGPVCADGALNRAWTVDVSTVGALRLNAFDTTTFARVATLDLTGAHGTVPRLIRWGAKGLALFTTDGQVVVVPVAPGL